MNQHLRNILLTHTKHDVGKVANTGERQGESKVVRSRGIMEASRKRREGPQRVGKWQCVCQAYSMEKVFSDTCWSTFGFRV